MENHAKKEDQGKVIGISATEEDDRQCKELYIRGLLKRIKPNENIKDFGQKGKLNSAISRLPIDQQSICIKDRETQEQEADVEKQESSACRRTIS